MCVIQYTELFTCNHLLAMWCISEWYKIFNRKNVGRGLVLYNRIWLIGSGKVSMHFKRNKYWIFCIDFSPIFWNAHCIVLYLKVEGNVSNLNVLSEYYLFFNRFFSLTVIKIKKLFTHKLKFAAFYFTRCYLLDWSGVGYLWINVMFLSAGSHSDGTHSL